MNLAYLDSLHEAELQLQRAIRLHRLSAQALDRPTTDVAGLVFPVAARPRMPLGDRPSTPQRQREPTGDLPEAWNPGPSGPKWEPA